MSHYPEKLFGLIGFPLSHSFSQKFFNEKFEREHIDARYLNFELPDITDFMEVIAENRNLVGLNVTIPYKEKIIPYMDQMDYEAKIIGAVNTIRVLWDENDQPHFQGYNTDVVGFRDSLRPLLTPEMDKALILGTGGAAKAVAEALNTLGIEWLMVSRTKRDDHTIKYQDIDTELMHACKLIVNTTPLGMYPNVDECPDIPYEDLTHQHLCYDLLYNPEVTMFMRKAKRYGAKVKNGWEMLVLQADASWAIWCTKDKKEDKEDKEDK